MNIQDVMEKKAKELIGKWGYEEEYWWKPVKEALLEIYQQGRKDGVKEAIEALQKNPKQDGTDSRAYFIAGYNQCRLDFVSFLTKLV